MSWCLRTAIIRAWGNWTDYTVVTRLVLPYRYGLNWSDKIKEIHWLHALGSINKVRSNLP
jgi:hypothetical protein